MARPRPRSLRARPPWRARCSVRGNSRVFPEGEKAPAGGMCEGNQCLAHQHSKVLPHVQENSQLLQSESEFREEQKTHRII